MLAVPMAASLAACHVHIQIQVRATDGLKATTGSNSYRPGNLRAGGQPLRRPLRLVNPSLCWLACLLTAASLLALLSAWCMFLFQVGAWVYLPPPTSAPYSTANIQLQEQQPVSAAHQPTRTGTTPRGSHKTPKGHQNLGAEEMADKDQVAIGESCKLLDNLKLSCLLCLLHAFSTQPAGLSSAHSESKSLLACLPTHSQHWQLLFQPLLAC